jgi:N-acetylglutamate synthase-like GNAT family acetyltransferase
MVEFIEISENEVKENYHDYFWENTIYFYIKKDLNIVGLYGVIKRSELIGESFLTIFKDFRYKILGREFMISLLKHASSLGFEEIYTWTYWESWKKLGMHFEKYGVQYCVEPYRDKEDKEKMWFKYKCREGSQ